MGTGDLGAALRELCKYTTKLGDIVYYPALVRECLDYACRHRMVVTFGCCYGLAGLLAELLEREVPEVEVFDPEVSACPACGVAGRLA